MSDDLKPVGMTVYNTLKGRFWALNAADKDGIAHLAIDAIDAVRSLSVALSESVDKEAMRLRHERERIEDIETRDRMLEKAEAYAAAAFRAIGKAGCDLYDALNGAKSTDEVLKLVRAAQAKLDALPEYEIGTINGAVICDPQAAHDSGADPTNPVHAVDTGFVQAVKRLVIAGRTSGGTAGRDEGLCAALDAVEAHLQTIPSQCNPQEPTR